MPRALPKTIPQALQKKCRQYVSSGNAARSDSSTSPVDASLGGLRPQPAQYQYQAIWQIPEPEALWQATPTSKLSLCHLQPKACQWETSQSISPKAPPRRHVPMNDDVVLRFVQHTFLTTCVSTFRAARHRSVVIKVGPDFFLDASWYLGTSRPWGISPRPCRPWTQGAKNYRPMADEKTSRYLPSICGYWASGANSQCQST